MDISGIKCCWSLIYDMGMELSHCMWHMRTIESQVIAPPSAAQLNPNPMPELLSDMIAK